MDAPGNTASRQTTDFAIEACDMFIRQHNRSSRLVLVLAIFLILIILAFSIIYAHIERDVLEDSRIRQLYEIEVHERAVLTVKNDVDRIISNIESDEQKLRYIREVNYESNDEANNAEKHAKNIELNLSRAQSSLEWRQKDLERLESKLNELKNSFRDSKPKTLIPETLLYGIAGAVIIIISVFISLYRFHLREIAKNQQYKLGFLRIQTASYNGEKDNFHVEIRRALIEGAFDFTADGFGSGRNKKLENPLPGHLSSDLLTEVTNKVLQRIDVLRENRKGTA